VVHALCGRPRRSRAVVTALSPGGGCWKRSVRQGGNCDCPLLLWPWVGFEVKPMSEMGTAGQLITGIQRVWAEARAIA
jgi:hypothetical protein